MPASRVFAHAFSVLILLLSIAPADAGPLEYAVKATFVPKFAPFVQWPAAAIGPPGTPLVICVQGDDPVAALTERAAAGQVAWSRPVAVHRLAVIGASSGCHIAYIAGSSAQPLGQALAALRRAPVLTVTDAGATKGGRGMIDFALSGDRVTFDIDDAAAAESGLIISSKLLGLARSVNRR